MSLTLPIVIGRKYVRRDGTVVTARERHPNIDPGQVYIGPDQDADQDPYEHVDANTGLAYINAKYPSDLIADHIETAGHPHAALMLEYAQDAMKTAEPWKLWQHSDMQTGWFDCEEHPKWGTVMEYRRKPRTIRIGEFDVPEPLREAVPDQADYWLAEITGGQARAVECCNFTPSTCLTHIASGVAHLTREAAEQHARALLSFTEQK